MSIGFNMHVVRSSAEEPLIRCLGSRVTICHSSVSIPLSVGARNAKAIDWVRAHLQEIEAVQSGTELFALVLEPTTADRFARAETAIERRMYRALAVLFATRAGDGAKAFAAEDHEMKTR